MICPGHADVVDGQEVTCRYCRDAYRNAKLGAAYMAAVEASHSGTAATIEVGQDVWDYLMSIREVDTGVFKGMEWLTGIPVACQAQWPHDFRIHVVTRKEIA